MNDSSTADVYTDDAHPNVRVRLVWQTDPEHPDGDALPPVVRIPDYRGDAEYVSDYRPADLDASRLGEAWRQLNDWEKLERWLRMFYGATTVHQFGNNRDVTLVMFDTPDWREHVGAEVKDGKVDLSGDRAEWQAWLDGDVYGVIVETRATASTVVRDSVTGEVIRESEDEVWEHEDASYGYYGTEHAELEARQQLADYIRDTTEDE